ncbi:putative RNA-binding domain superfamily [Helianthus annuus]|uniref:Putative nucleotide-binding alpha-beta plait domain-containing protein n=1 Tax=Helianthus annuus TaxID=4232 RepID=A0A251SCI0_HELAN|nr:putative RNA-binding domain superfamily [Helianthus annuus]KAJ0833082.1 putative RNA-binding domain superfamily [Helianthus annuus]
MIFLGCLTDNYTTSIRPKPGRPVLPILVQNTSHCHPKDSDSRGLYKYADEAQKAVDRLDGGIVDGREIMVQFATYEPDPERMWASYVTAKMVFCI